MKRFFLVFILAIMSLISCSSDDDSSNSQIPVIDPLVGTWRLTSWTVDGVEQGLGCHTEEDLIFNLDGSFSTEDYVSNGSGVCVLDDTTTGTWARISDGVYSSTVGGMTQQGTLTFSNNNNNYSTTDNDGGEIHINTYTRQ